jgi:hypothetical protein
MKHETETALRLNAVSDIRGCDCEDLYTNIKLSVKTPLFMTSLVV